MGGSAAPWDSQGPKFASSLHYSGLVWFYSQTAYDMKTSVTSTHGVKGKKRNLPREEKKNLFSERLPVDFFWNFLASGLDCTPISASTTEQTAKVSAKGQQTFEPWNWEETIGMGSPCKTERASLPDCERLGQTVGWIK